MKCKIDFHLNRGLRNSVVFILNRQTFLAQALIQDWLDMNATVVAPLLKMSVYGGSCCTDTSLIHPHEALQIIGFFFFNINILRLGTL